MDKLDPKTTALVLIDLQKGILGYPFAPSTADEVQASAIALIQAFHAAGSLVVVTRAVHASDFADALKLPVDQPSRAGGTLPENWAEIPAELGLSDKDLVIDKKQWGAFYGTELDLQLRRRGIRTIVLGGIATNMGVESTARSAWEHNYALVFAKDATSSVSADMHQFSVEKIFPQIGRVRSNAEILDMLG